MTRPIHKVGETREVKLVFDRGQYLETGDGGYVRVNFRDQMKVIEEFKAPTKDSSAGWSIKEYLFDTLLSDDEALQKRYKKEAAEKAARKTAKRAARKARGSWWHRLKVWLKLTQPRLPVAKVAK